MYGRPEYEECAIGSPMNLHSWYLILWANFGAFCIGLISQPDARERIEKVLPSFHTDIHHYCVAQMRSIWLHMNSGMNLFAEKITFFIDRAMSNLVKVINSILIY